MISIGTASSVFQLMLIILAVLYKVINDMKVLHTDDDPTFVSHYDSGALHEMLDTQHRLT